MKNDQKRHWFSFVLIPGKSSKKLLHWTFKWAGWPILDRGQTFFGFWNFSIRSFKFLVRRLVSFRCIPVYSGYGTYGVRLPWSHQYGFSEHTVLWHLPCEQLTGLWHYLTLRSWATGCGEVTHWSRKLKNKRGVTLSKEITKNDTIRKIHSIINSLSNKLYNIKTLK